MRQAYAKRGGEIISYPFEIIHARKTIENIDLRKELLHDSEYTKKNFKKNQTENQTKIHLLGAGNAWIAHLAVDFRDKNKY